ncbi:DUF1178 family protein [Poseidonocella sedimentorum]|uniref:DUF1178 family protein n=1 Tax=Poseidonocella sedimentorum TaxID=871652 RepID=A0A1I6EFF0_9RHOB|nr:DUF1178 family protein [Poseidonocella sedimentorum]SFR16222.1 hypothetical protein SAMN04515673_11112 [Poseidonocella sedimentorum]
MIHYALKCQHGHSFESWFQSSDAFETLKSAGHVACAVCGSSEVEKSLMAPRVAAPRSKAPDAALSTPANPAEAALAEMRRKLAESSEYVGTRFADEARAMHDGAAEQRAIHGEARLEDAKRLVEDGVPIAPLPFVPPRKTH